MQTQLQKIKNFSVKFLASGLGAGYLPKAPGTWGTCVAIPLAYFLHFKGHTNYLVFTVLFTFFACGIAEFASQLYKVDDCQLIVIDEIAGFLVTMALLPMTWQALMAGFILFRVLDATKPGPIGYLDRKVKGGIGVVVDDVAAGILANIILQVIYVNTSWLGAQAQ